MKPQTFQALNVWRLFHGVIRQNVILRCQYITDLSQQLTGAHISEMLWKDSFQKINRGLQSDFNVDWLHILDSHPVL